MIVTGGIIPDGSGVALLARIEGNGGQPITQADIASITWTLTDLVTPAALGSGSFVVATSVFNGLVQNDLRWQIDSETQPGRGGHWGYNFAAVIPASSFPVSTVTRGNVAADLRVQADVFFTPTLGQPFRVPFRWQRLPVFG